MKQIFSIISFVFVAIFAMTIPTLACPPGVVCNVDGTSVTTAEAQTGINADWTYGDQAIGGKSYVNGLGYVKAIDPITTEVVANHPALVTGSVDGKTSMAASWQKPTATVNVGKPVELKTTITGDQQNWSSLKDTADPAKYGAAAGNRTCYYGNWNSTNPGVKTLTAEGEAVGTSKTTYNGSDQIGAETIGAAKAVGSVPGGTGVAGAGGVNAYLITPNSIGAGKANFEFGANAGPNCPGLSDVTGRAYTDTINNFNIGANGITIGVAVKSGASVTTGVPQ